jgi:hypothetical protein
VVMKSSAFWDITACSPLTGLLSTDNTTHIPGDRTFQIENDCNLDEERRNLHNILCNSEIKYIHDKEIIGYK